MCDLVLCCSSVLYTVNTFKGSLLAEMISIVHCNRHNILCTLLYYTLLVSYRTSNETFQLAPHFLLLSHQRISDLNTMLSMVVSDDFFSHYRLAEFLTDLDDHIKYQLVLVSRS